MERTVVSRTRVSIAVVLGVLCLAVVAAGCGGSSSAATPPASTTTGTTPTPTTPNGGGNASAFQAFRECLTAHGVTLPARPAGGGGGQPPTGGQPPANGARPAGGRFGNLTAKQQAAVTACQSKRPAGGFGGGNARGGPANPALAKYTACLKSHGVTFGSTSSSSSAFAKATAACKSLLPANGGTATP
jgi:hypothetical protein